jgi:hypothetical protein
MISQADNLVLQSYYSVSLIAELRNNAFLESHYFESMKFSAPWIKEEIKSIGVDNQGSLLMSLYAMLVIPRELIFKKYPDKVDDIQRFLRSKCKITKNEYQTQIESIDILRHIRNSVSHASVAFVPKSVMIFSDENTRAKKTIEIELSLEYVSSFLSALQELQELHLMHIRNSQNATVKIN